MSSRLRTFLGGPIGRLRFDVYELPTIRGSAPAGVRRLEEADLAAAAATGEVVPGEGYRSRLAAGDIAVGIDGPDGDLAGVLWVGLDSESDAYGGPWTAVSADVGYLNQLVVAPSHRGEGLSHRLLEGALVVAGNAGRTSVRGLVKPGNAASRTIIAAKGGRLTHRLYGVRVGRFTLRVVPRQR